MCVTFVWGYVPIYVQGMEMMMSGSLELESPEVVSHLVYNGN